MDYDQAYSETRSYFGNEADPLLARAWTLIPRDAQPSTVLDLGAGQGRHALFLSQNGLDVHAVDPSGVATSTLQSLADQQDLRITTSTCGFQDIGTDRTYAAVLLLGLIQLLPRDQIESLAERVTRWLSPGGLVYITAFSTDDPAYPRVSSQWQRLAPGSYRSPEGVIATYLEPDEAPRLFPGLEIVHHWHGLGPWHQHGDGEQERHGRIEAILRRPD